MPYSHAILFDLAIKGLYDSTALWNKMNRSYDRFMNNDRGTSAQIPKNPQLVALTEGVAEDDARRKSAIGDTDMITVPFDTITIPMSQEIEDELLLGNYNINNFVSDCDAAFSHSADGLVLASIAAEAGVQKIDSKSDVLCYEDILQIDQTFNERDIPQAQRIVVIPASRTVEFKNIELVKQAMAYNQKLLESGVFIIDGKQFYISSRTPKVEGRDAIYGIHTQNMVVVLKGYMVRKDVYSLLSRKTPIDYNSGLAKKLCRPEGAVIVKMKAVA
jgi:hypothetical protein